MMQPGEEAKIDVTWEDQQYINTFGRLNRRMNEMKAELARKKAGKEAVQDAANDIMLSDDETVLYAIGDGFVRMSKEAAEEKLAQDEAEVDKEIEELVAKMDDTKEQMNKLKVILYAKFQNSINLEEDDD